MGQGDIDGVGELVDFDIAAVKVVHGDSGFEVSHDGVDDFSVSCDFFVVEEDDFLDGVFDGPNRVLRLECLDFCAEGVIVEPAVFTGGAC